MWTWIWAAVAVLGFAALGRAKMKWRQQELALESYIVMLLFSEETHRGHQAKLRDWVRDFPARDAASLSIEAHVAIGQMVSDWAATKTLNLGAHALLWEVKETLTRSPERTSGSDSQPDYSEGVAAIIGLPPEPLARISKELASSDNVETVTQELLSGSDRTEKSKEALVAYCEANEKLREVMQEFGATRETILGLYTRLQAAGAGQWVGGHYVSASAIAYPHTLRYLLNTPLETKDQLIAAAFTMIMHFERGAP